MSRITINGNVINIATKKEAMSVLETTIGIDLINSPIMPDARRRGTNAQTVVSVVVKIATIKSFQTRIPVSSAVNFPDLK